MKVLNFLDYLAVFCLYNFAADCAMGLSLALVGSTFKDTWVFLAIVNIAIVLSYLYYVACDVNTIFEASIHQGIQCVTAVLFCITLMVHGYYAISVFAKNIVSWYVILRPAAICAVLTSAYAYFVEERVVSVYGAH